MSSSKKFKSCITSKKFIRADLFIILLAAALFALCWVVRLPFSEAFSTKTSISLGYQAKQGPDGNYYAIDESHERLICFDEAGTVRFAVSSIECGIGEVSYIDDFSVTANGLYISASEWNEMSIAREAVVLYSLEGEYIETCMQADYSNEYINKHRFYGAAEINGEILVADCREDEILIGEYTIPYENAFNAVSDVEITDHAVYILDKSGVLTEYSDETPSGAVVYSSANDGGNVVPYRLFVSDNADIYFTDIRNDEVRLVDASSQTSSKILDASGSLTVSLTESGEFIITPGDSVNITGTGGSDTVYSSLDKNAASIMRQFIFIAAFAVFAVLACIICIRLVILFAAKEYSRIQRVSFLMLGAVAVVAILLCSILMNSFAAEYRNKIREQVETAAYMIANQIDGDDIENIEETGGFGGEAYDRLCDIMNKSFPMDIDFYRQIYCNILKIPSDGSAGYAVAYLDQSVGAYFPLDESEQIDLVAVKSTGRSVWNQEVEDISGTYLSVKVPVYNDSGEICGAVAVGVETYVISDTINEMLRGIILSILVILLIVWIVSVEIMLFINGYGSYKQELASGNRQPFPGHVLRILVFLIFAAYNMTASFLPAYLLHKAEIFPKDMESLASALPVTVNIFLIGVMSLFCARFIKRLGLRNVMVFSALCSLFGNLIIFLIPDYFAIFAGLILDGVGVGLITNSVYIMISRIKNESDRTRGLSVYNSAYLSGINFGMMAGSLLAVNLDRQDVFIVVAVTWAILILVTGPVIRRIGMITESSGETAESKTVKPLSTGKYIGNRKVLGFIVLIQNPYIVFGSFVFYYLPLFCDMNGYGEALCSLFIMIYSQAAILLSGALTACAAKMRKINPMYLALGLNIAAIIVYAVSQNLAGMIAALLILGVSAAFGKPVQQTYYLDMNETKKYGEDRAMGIYNFSENIGESLGPTIFARVISAGSMRASLGIFCALTGGMGLLHKIICSNKTKNNYESND
ncbi:MAG TPA: MFS transporter [Candidatus Alectryocaccobium stercorigallinarum]|nr:MFS transporter [Candidatus Alectryocaccobium stercorigallinarum]